VHGVGPHAVCAAAACCCVDHRQDNAKGVEVSKGRTIVILGMGHSSMVRSHGIKAHIPDGAEVWGLNNGYLCFPDLADGGWSRFYELHSWNYLKTWDASTPNGPPVDHFKELADLRCEVCVSEPLPLVPNQTVINWGEVFDKLGTNYFLGSPSMMLAHALYEHSEGAEIDQIITYGIDTNDGRHAQQRHSWAYWLAHCGNAGIIFGGTACAFMEESDNDIGLQGMREKTGRYMVESDQRRNMINIADDLEARQA